MTKSELISIINEQFPQLTITDTSLSIQAILDSMCNALANDDHIEIRGFGSFSVNTRPPRLARNPKTGEKVEVAAKHN